MTNTILIPRNWRVLLAFIALITLIPFSVENDYFLLLFNVTALNALVVLGLNLLIGSTGQVSLGHAAFYGLGAYLTAIASTTWQWPLLLSLGFSLAAVGIISFVLALPTLRLEGHYLVMATLGFNIIVSILFNQMDGITGGPSGFPGIPQLHLGNFVLDTDLKFYVFIWSIFVIFLALTLNLVDSRLGRALLAIHEKEITAKSLGIASERYKVTVFVLSALYAAFAGFCYAHYVTFISPKTFDIFYSVQVVTMVVVGGMGSLWGGLLGTALLTSLPEILHRFEDLHVLIYGLILMGVLVFSPKGLVPAIFSLRRFFRKKGGELTIEATPDRDRKLFQPRRAGKMGLAESDVLYSTRGTGAEELYRTPMLCLDRVSLSFGGLQAIYQVDLSVFPGEIVALIGPNGAGKTTVLNVISGLLRADEGTVTLNGEPIRGMPPHVIAARGVGRTFQAVQLYEEMTVLENVLLGYHTRGRTGFLAAYLHTPQEREEESNLRQLAHELLAEFDLLGKSQMKVRRLSLLEQKMLELIRALALSPNVLLLDEPVGGLNPRESEVLVNCLMHLRNRGIGTLLVEHDMNVVMRLADRIVVLHHGCRIASGTPDEIQKDPKVIAAYLGRANP